MNPVELIAAGDSISARDVAALRIEDFADGATVQIDGAAAQGIYALGTLFAPPGRPWRTVKVVASSAGPVAVRFDSEEGGRALAGPIARKGQRYLTGALAANAAVGAGAPAAATDGYALSPGMSALRITLRDNAQARQVVKWLRSGAGYWAPAGLLVSTPGQEIVFEVSVPVGVGRVALQAIDGLGALNADIDSEVFQ